MSTIQPHQIPRLPHNTYATSFLNARSNRCHHPTSPNTAPATQNHSHAWLSSHMQPHFQCAEQQVSPSNLTKYCACHEKWHCNMPEKCPKNGWKRHFQCGADPSMIRPWNRQSATRLATEVTFRAHHEHFPIVKYNVLRPILHSNFHQVLRLPRKVTLELHQITAPATKSDTWTSPSTAPATKSDTWTWLNTAPATKSDTWTSPSIAPAHTERLECLIVITYETSFYNARSNRCHHPTSPNTAPATQSDSYAWSLSHMKRHLHCAEQQVSPSNLTKYCACHEKWHCKISKKISQKQVKRHFQCGADPTMIRAWSDHENANRNPPRKWGYFSRSPESIVYCKIQRFAPNLTFKPSPNTAPATKRCHLNFTKILRLPRKVTLWTSPSTAPATTSDTRTSLLYSTWLYSTWLYSTLLDSAWLYLTLLDSTWF